MKGRVIVGMSGGVDSSVAAALLKEDGYEVIGLFMRNWHEKDESGICCAEEDFSDVKRVCATLDIPYYSVDFSKEYWDRVFELFVSEYAVGRTPNPDVLCNKEIKFGAFAEYAAKFGADYIATGHYAGTVHRDGSTYLVRAADENKDQTYFLNQLSEKQLKNVIFPLQAIQKDEVRRIATELHLSTATKKDSTGVCFIGERRFREFLKNYIPMKEGDIICDGRIVGRHSGVYYYTLGQRRGLGIGGDTGGDRWFVVGKDVEHNVLYVSKGEEDCLYSSVLTSHSFNFINGVPKASCFRALARIRHRQPLQQATVTLENGNVRVDFDEPQRAIVAGQYVVLYDDRTVLGGGVID